MRSPGFENYAGATKFASEGHTLDTSTWLRKSRGDPARRAAHQRELRARGRRVLWAARQQGCSVALAILQVQGAADP